MHNSGKWTEARFTSFIKGILRAGSNKWPPKYATRKQAWRERGLYECAGYGRKRHSAPASVVVKGKRTNNIFVDHIKPIIGRAGFTSWDDFISNLFCEVDNLQVLCKQCHDAKSKSEKEERKAYGRTK